jgi:hypothetical protein
MTSPPPPAYGTQDYWESRFKANTETYDWLEHASLLDSEIVEALKASDDPSPKILHIGCGTSMLSIHLRAFVKDPRQIQHIDFSAEAIEWGRKLEKDTFNFDWDEDVPLSTGTETYTEARAILQLHKAVPMMKWTQTSLLSLESVISTCELGGYQVIVDKSCCDAIACASWVKIPLPFFLRMEVPLGDEASEQSSSKEDEYSIYPVNLLAIHLALVARPGARWIALSYSNDRWPFFPNESNPESTAADQALPKELLDKGFPDPAKLWSLSKKERVMEDKTDAGEDKLESRGHWIYVFERTDVELKVLGV